MTECTACGDKPKHTAGAFPKAVVEINNPEQLVLLRKVVMPATLPEADNPPAIGKYRNVILKYEDTGNVYIYSSDGIPTAIEANVPQEILNKIADLEEDLATETELRQTGDADLRDRIDAVANSLETEETRRISADDALRSSINTVSGNLSAEISARQSADTAIRGDLTTLTGRVTTAEGDIDTIESKIPNQATAQNQLADKDFVNSSIATNTANFIGTFNSVAELEAYSGTVTNNDYAFVIVTDAQGNTAYDRYKYNGDTEQWMFEYELNNSSFTAEQWAAINSGITSGNVTKLSGLANIKTIGANLSLSQTGELSATDTTYTAGNGLSLNGTQFSVDTTTIATQSDLTTGLATKQNTLTAGANVQINNDTISATDTTYSNFTGTDGTSTGAAGLVPAPATTDAGKVLGANGAWVTGGPTVVQTTGTSTTNVMSQNAVSEMVFHSGEDQTRIEIGQGALATPNGNYPIAIGVSAQVDGIYNNAIAIGHYAISNGNYGLAIGSGTSTTNRTRASQAGVALGTNSNAATSSVAFSYGDATASGQFDISTSRYNSGQGGGGYNGSGYRLLTGVYDPQSDHDAATKGYADSLIPAATFTTNEWNALWA